MHLIYNEVFKVTEMGYREKQYEEMKSDRKVRQDLTKEERGAV